MEILISKNTGACFGVKRALNIIEKILKDEQLPVYTLGPVIHNPPTVKELKKKGVRIINNINRIRNKIVIIRTHGEKKEIFDMSKENNIKLIDATCPYVKRVQNLVKRLKNDGYEIVIIGDRTHPEVQGILSYINNGAYVFNQKVDIPKNFSVKKLGIVAQTTQSVDNYKSIINKILTYDIKELKIYNTICDATINNQKEAKKLAKKVDLMLVLGGKNSANTKRLYEICKKINKESYHIEDEKDIDKDWFLNKEKIGICAGTSTPSWIIDKVKNYLTVPVSRKSKLVAL